MERLFNVYEVNLLIPRLERDLDRMQQLLRDARQANRDKELVRAVGYNSDGHLIMAADYQEAERSLRRIVRELNDLIEGIHREGGQIKDIERGLVDFPAIIDGKRVFLCWQKGETKISYYHDERTGYAGRRPLNPDDA